MTLSNEMIEHYRVGMKRLYATALHGDIDALCDQALAPTQPMAWKARSMANIPYNKESRLVGFVVSESEFGIGDVVGTLEKIIAQKVVWGQPTHPAQPADFQRHMEMAAKVCDILTMGDPDATSGCAAGAARCARAIRALRPPEDV